MEELKGIELWTFEDFRVKRIGETDFYKKIIIIMKLEKLKFQENRRNNRIDKRKTG